MHFITSLFGTETTLPVYRVEENLPPQEQTAYNYYGTYKYTVDANAQKGNHKKFKAEVRSRTPRIDLPPIFVNVGTYNTVNEAVKAIENHRKMYSWDFNYYGDLVGRVKAR